MTPFISRAKQALVATMLCVPLSSYGAAVTTLAGASFTGAHAEFDALGKTVSLDDAAYALEDCDAITLTAPATVVTGPMRGVWLHDGSWLPATEVRAGGDDAVVLIGPLGELTLPLTAIQAWGEDELSESANDQVVVASGRLEGHILGIKDGRLILQSELDTTPLNLALADIQAARLAGSHVPPRGIHLTVTLNEQRPPLALLPGKALRLAAAANVAVQLPPGLSLRVEGGRRVYLSTLPTEQVSETGAFGVVWPHTRDANLDGTPLSLGGARFAKGFVVHSQAKLTWRLDGKYERLRAIAGISDAVGDEGDCAATISADGKTLWHSASIKGRDKPFPLDLSLAGARLLELSVEFGERYDIGDHFALADAYLVKALEK